MDKFDVHQMLTKAGQWRKMAVVIGDETGAASATPKSVS
jgi:hypothetical protein